MPKEYYSVSHKTYFNERIKPVVFRSKESHPLYVQVTYDRRTVFFKSYYFDLFAKPKYDFLKTTIAQIDDLEAKAIDFLIERNSGDFDLDELVLQYRLITKDILDDFDPHFQSWLTYYLKKQGYGAIADLVSGLIGGVSGIWLWEDLKKMLDPKIFEAMEVEAVQAGPYLPIAMWMRKTRPGGPFCMPVFEWGGDERNIAIENFINERFPHLPVTFLSVLRMIPRNLFRNWE